MEFIGDLRFATKKESTPFPDVVILVSYSSTIDERMDATEGVLQYVDLSKKERRYYS